jgi:hypothetical protein
MVIEIEGVHATRYLYWSGKEPAFAKHLKTWGEAGTVKLKIKATPKVADRGVQCMFVGYAIDHEGDCYRMRGPNTSRIHETRDIIWMQRMFYQQQLPEANLALDPIEFQVHDKVVREGVDNGNDNGNKAENDFDESDDDDDGGG